MFIPLIRSKPYQNAATSNNGCRTDICMSLLAHHLQDLPKTTHHSVSHLPLRNTAQISLKNYPPLLMASEACLHRTLHKPNLDPDPGPPTSAEHLWKLMQMAHRRATPKTGTPDQQQPWCDSTNCSGFYCINPDLFPITDIRWLDTQRNIYCWFRAWIMRFWGIKVNGIEWLPCLLQNEKSPMD